MHESALMRVNTQRRTREGIDGGGDEEEGESSGPEKRHREQCVLFRRGRRPGLPTQNEGTSEEAHRRRAFKHRLFIFVLKYGLIRFMFVFVL